MKSQPYQIDCQMTKKGKMFAGTKRRVHWKVGIASDVAINAGHTGLDCRGEEHDIVLVWSLTSGKQLVLADGHEVHWSKSRTLDKFECDWKMVSGHQVKVIAHVSTPLFDKKPNFRQFDLIVDGVSFFDMPKMFELGVNCQSNMANQQQPRVRSAPPSSTPNNTVPRSVFQRSISQQVHYDPDEDDIMDHVSVVSCTQASFYTSQSPQVPSMLDQVSGSPPRAVSPSPSMPDLFDTMMSSSQHNTPPPVNVPKINPFSVSSSPMLIPQTGTPSPTSVMNPFDLYSIPSSSQEPPKTLYNDPWSLQQQQQYQGQYYQQQTTALVPSPQTLRQEYNGYTNNERYPYSTPTPVVYAGY